MVYATRLPSGEIRGLPTARVLTCNSGVHVCAVVAIVAESKSVRRRINFVDDMCVDTPIFFNDGFETDWSAGILACNIAAAAMSAPVLSNQNRFSCFALMQAGIPALQSFFSNQGKFPQHSILFLVKNIYPVRDPPHSVIFPSPDRQFIEQRHGMGRLYGVKKRLVRGVKLLISAPSVSGVMDLARRRPVKIRIARIYPSEVRQQRDQSPVPMINSISHPVDLGNLIPRKDITELELYARYHF